MDNLKDSYGIKGGFMKKAYLGVLLFLLAAIVLYGMAFDYGKWWMLVNILIVEPL